MTRVVFIESIRAQGFLSFHPDSAALELHPLNVFIGANGAGKSNMIEAVRFLQVASRRKPIDFLLRSGSGVGDWIWQRGREGDGIASVELVIRRDKPTQLPLRYRLAFRDNRSRVEVVDERLEEAAKARATAAKPRFFIGHEKAGVYVNRQDGGRRKLQKEQVDPEGSVLSIYNAPADYPENAWLVDALGKIELFSDPLFGRGSELRRAQSVSGSRSRLEENGSNLGLVLNRVVQSRSAREEFSQLVREVYPFVDSVEVDISDGTIQVVFDEGGGTKTRAPRLSDGTMRWVFLLTLLLDETNSGPIFLDEPDLGLHPDALSALAGLLRRVSERRQIVVATHNVGFVDLFTDSPEAVVAFDNRWPAKAGGPHATHYRRLSASLLGGLRLGEAWQRGFLGAVRW